MRGVLDGLVLVAVSVVLSGDENKPQALSTGSTFEEDLAG
jgi:hypothetical protein